MLERSTKTVLVYDGDCLFCSAYVRMVRLRQAVGPVDLVDARAGGAVVEALWERGYDLNEGMALLTTSSSTFNRLNALLFRSPTASRLLYPLLRFGRNTVLRFMGRRKLPGP